MPRTTACLLALCFITPTFSTEPVDLDIVTRIREEGLHRSRVMETAAMLTDVIGPRLTGSPQMKRANEWTRDHLAGWGLEDARLESYEFGQGWSFSRAVVRMTEPHEMPLIALTLSATRGNQLKAAQLLGINRNTLRKRIRELDIPVTRGKKLM